jgi:hypothetical protein
VVSTTVILNVAVPVLPRPSDAEQVTVVAPRAKVEFLSGTQVTIRGSPRSTAVGRTKSTTEPAKPFASTVLSAGTLLRTGGVVSTTVTLNVLLALLLCESVALQVTVVCPIENVAPEAGVQLEVETASSGSAALKAKVTAAPPNPVAWAVMSAGTVITGGVWSATMTWKLVEAEWPLGSLAEQLTVVDPTGNAEPEAGVQLTVTTPATASVAVGFV